MGSYRKGKSGGNIGLKGAAGPFTVSVLQTFDPGPRRRPSSGSSRCGRTNSVRASWVQPELKCSAVVGSCPTQHRGDVAVAQVTALGLAHLLPALVFGVGHEAGRAGLRLRHHRSRGTPCSCYAVERDGEPAPRVRPVGRRGSDRR